MSKTVSRLFWMMVSKKTSAESSTKPSQEFPSGFRAIKPRPAASHWRQDIVIAGLLSSRKSRRATRRVSSYRKGKGGRVGTWSATTHHKPKAAKQCAVCYDDKPASVFTRLAAGCQHTPNVCNACVRRYLKAEVKQMKEGGIKCPSVDCAQSIDVSSISSYAGQRVAYEVNHRLSLRFLQTLDDFRWCAHERCGNGQLIEGESSYMICNACGGRTCISHRCVWHDGRSCVEYDAWIESQKNGGAKSSTWIQRNTQQCPKCKHAVQKNGGCDHMRCHCSFEFCYRCGADYKAILRTDNSHHKSTCCYYRA